MSHEEWTFAEEQRNAVCEGEMCPRCLSTNVILTGHSYDMINLNAAYDCADCGEQWEGY